LTGPIIITLSNNFGVHSFQFSSRIASTIETPILPLLGKAKFYLFWWLKANNTTLLCTAFRDGGRTFYFV